MNDFDNRVAENVGRLISYDPAATPTLSSSRSSFARLERRLVTRRGRAVGLQAMLGVAVALVVAGAAYRARSRWLPLGNESLTFQVESGPSLEKGGIIEGRSDALDTDVTFSDGTQIRMKPRARGRVVSLDRWGARVELESGSAHVDVRHRAKAKWAFQAGPFEVRVTGTAFSLAWDPATAHFDLHMESGVVSVAGPISGGEMVLRAGETLSVGLRDAESGPAASNVAGERSRDGATSPPLAATSVVADAPSSSTSVRPTHMALGRVGGSAHVGKNWREELANGHADAVVADARRRGLGRVLQSASSEDLAALADAARYVGDDDLARRALLAQRERFADTARAAQASFLLGRLEQEGAGNAGRALDWYDRYLAEAPHGAYVSEALGRKMMVLDNAQRREQAMAIASDYLRRFPAGSYAHAARVLVRTGKPPTEAPPSAGP